MSFLRPFPRPLPQSKSPRAIRWDGENMVLCFVLNIPSISSFVCNQTFQKQKYETNLWCLSFTIVQVHERRLHCQPDSFHGRWCSWGCWSEPHSLSKIFFQLTIIFSNNMMFPPPVLIPVLRVIFILWEMFIEVTFRFHESSHFHYMRCVSRTFGFRELSVIVDFIYSGVRIGGTCCGKGVLS